MSLYDFYKSRKILDDNPTLAALIMAAAEKATPMARDKIESIFPRIVKEFKKRRHTSLNMLDGDEFQITLELDGRTSKFRKIYREESKICLKQ